jgi:hypothetical protein
MTDIQMKSAPTPSSTPYSRTPRTTWLPSAPRTCPATRSTNDASTLSAEPFGEQKECDEARELLRDWEDAVRNDVQPDLDSD